MDKEKVDPLAYVESLVDNRYRLTRLLGSGGNASVYHAEEVSALARLGEVAVKLLFEDEHDLQDIDHEVSALKSSPHPHIVGFKQSNRFELHGRRAVYLAMELASETLRSRLGNLPDDDTETMLVSVAMALAFLHSKMMVHNDVKPENIFWIKNAWKLGDFGLARRRDFAFKQKLGTLAYAAPEILIANQRSSASDVYALGATLFECLTGELVYPANNVQQFEEMLRTRPIAIPATLAPRWQALLASCLARLPQERCTAAEIAQRLWPAPLQASTAAAPKEARQTTAGRLVSAFGNGDYRTITEALRTAKAGERIVVLPGHYRESLSIDKPVHLVGQGPVQEIILEAVEPNTLHLRGDDIHVEGLTFRQKAKPSDDGYCAVLISAGKPRLSRCHFQSQALACLGICGAGTCPEVHDCKIYAGVDAGVYLFDTAHANLSGCDLSGHANSCAAIDAGSSGSFERCNFRGGRASGCHVAARAAAKLQECRLFSNFKAGITVASGGNVEVEQCFMQDNLCYGIWLDRDSTAVVKHCHLTRNRIKAWSIAKRCKLTNEHNDPGP